MLRTLHGRLIVLTLIVVSVDKLILKRRKRTASPNTPSLSTPPAQSAGVLSTLLGLSGLVSLGLPIPTLPLEASLPLALWVTLGPPL